MWMWMWMLGMEAKSCVKCVIVICEDTSCLGVRSSGMLIRIFLAIPISPRCPCHAIIVGHVTM